MHAGLILLLHGSAPWHEAWTRWIVAPEITAPLALMGVLYALGVRRLYRRGLERIAPRWRQACFAAGWTTLAVALISPVHAISEQLFSAHMVQHELLMTVAAPLLVLGDPLVPFLVAIPTPARRVLARALAGPLVRRAWHHVSQPSVAFALHALAIWVWHLPAIFQQTLMNDAVHAAQHLSFLATAALFWWSLLDSSRVTARGAAVLYLFLTTLHTGALGALLAVSRTSWYPAYGSGPAFWGLTPVEDQQLAGLIMWIPGTVPYLIAALLLFRTWLSYADDCRPERSEGSAFWPGAKKQIRRFAQDDKVRRLA